MKENLILRNKLKLARVEKNLSQEELAKLVGVSRQTISSIETGQFCPTAKLALLLCIALDKKFEDIFYFEQGMISMKKFLKIRNILILLIIIVAIFFICWGRSDNVQNSKSYQLFKHFYEYGPEYGNTENNTIMRLENIGEEEIALTYATDYDNKREITSIEKLSQTSKDTMQTVQIINIISNEGRNTYFLF